MLREITTARQVPGDPKRRWFTSANFDLYVWLDEGEAPIGFQLCYDKQSREHALTWTASSGFTHMGVDGGESRPGRYKGAPILVANGMVDIAAIRDQFKREANALPGEFVRMIETRLAELSPAK